MKNKKIQSITKFFHSKKRVTDKAILFVDFDGSEHWIPKKLIFFEKKIKNEGIKTTLAVFKFEEIEKVKVEKLDSLFIDNDGEPSVEFVTENIPILESVKFPLLPKQLEIIKKAIVLRYSALFFETGTGKTLTSLTIANSRLLAGEVDNILIFAPAGLVSQWQSAIIDYFPNVEKHTKLLSIHSNSFDKSFEKTKKVVQSFKAKRTYLIVDESHLAKNQTAKRSRRMYHYLNFKYGNILSATPIGKNAGDLYYQFGILNKGLLNFENYSQFQKNFLLHGGKEGEEIVALKNTSDLKTQISPYIFNIKKNEVIETMPKKMYKKVHFNMNKNQKTAYNKLQNLIIDFQDTNGWLPDNKAFFFTTLLQKITSGFIPTDEDLKNLFTNIGKLGEGAKNLSDLKNVVYEIKESSNERLKVLNKTISKIEGKIIVYIKYIAEIESIKSFYKNAFVISGETKNNFETIEEFKKSKEQIIIINQSMSQGFNLQFVQTAIYFTTTFDIIMRRQSEERIFGRIGGAGNSVFVDLIANGTIDERIQDVLNYKLKVSNIFK